MSSVGSFTRRAAVDPATVHTEPRWLHILISLSPFSFQGRAFLNRIERLKHPKKQAFLLAVLQAFANHDISNTIRPRREKGSF